MKQVQEKEQFKTVKVHIWGDLGFLFATMDFAMAEHDTTFNVY